MRRGCDRIRVGSIAAKLSVLLALAAVHQTHAQNASRVSGTFPTASAPNPLKLNWSKEVLRDLGHIEGRNIGKNKAGEMSSADGSGAKGAKCPQRNSQSFFLRLSPGFGTRPPACARAAAKSSEVRCAAGPRRHDLRRAFYISIAVTWKKGGRDPPPACRSSR